MEPKLYIPKPCHEDWSRMTPAERGRHCDVCNKVVKDLTALNKIEALQVVSNSGEIEFCGRVNAAILDTAPAGWSVITGRVKTWGISVLAFIGFFFVQKKAWAQGTVGYIEETSLERSKHLSRSFTVYLKIENEDSLPVSYAVINIKGKNGKIVNFLSDVSGNVKISLDEKEFGNTVNIEVTCMGFETYSLNDFHVRKSETKLGIRLISKVITMAEFVRLGSQEEVLFGDIKEGSESQKKVWLGTVSGGIGYTGLIQSKAPNFEHDEVDNKTDEVEYPEVPLKLTAFPNPTTGVFTIESNKSNFFDIQVFDNNGKMILIQGNLMGREQLDLSGYAPGIYYVNVMENGVLLETKKVIVTR